MAGALDLSQYKNFVVKLIREQEARGAASDPEKLQILAESADDFLIKKWMWTICVIAGPTAFIAIPLLLCCAGILLPPSFMAILWFLAKGLMALVLILFAAVVVITLQSPSN
jgi:hypothetical protein